jgi:ribonuclease Z
MPEWIVLGSSYAIPDETHENTYLALVGHTRQVLIDCAGSPVVRLKQARIQLNALTDLFLTHFHPDHVAGVPSLLMSMWLLGRKEPLDVYGLPDTLDRMQKLMGFYEWEQWPDFFPVRFHRLPAKNLHPALKCDDFQIFTSPVSHLIPTIGLRIEVFETGQVLAYSCDTQPCEAVVGLAKDAAILFHEATGEHPGHSSASQAGQIAAQAGVKSLYLIHYDPQAKDLVLQAQKEFPGQVLLAEDFMRLEI